MQQGPNIRTWARIVLLLGGTLLIISSFRAPPAGINLAVDERGLSFQLRAAFLDIAFDIGQSCPKSDTCRKLLG